MREIKFRAWDKRIKQFVPCRDAGFEMDFSTGKIYSGYMNNITEHIELMQFTGLLDKNGKEIYESDIVRCVNGHVGTIIWEEHDCCFNVTDYYNSSNDCPSMAFFEGQPFEVIGNIYESPIPTI